MKKILLLSFISSALLAVSNPYGQVVYKTKQTIDKTNTNDFILDLSVGANFFKDTDALDDTFIGGIRFSKRMTSNSFVQVGFDQVFNAKYKQIKQTTSIKNTKNNRESIVTITEGEISLSRYYLNAMYEFVNCNQLYPYVFAGLGYEVASQNILDNQSFFNTGAGLRYKLNNRYSLIGETKAIKRLGNGDIDFVATLGLGIAFGRHTNNHTLKQRQTMDPIGTKYIIPLPKAPQPEPKYTFKETIQSVPKYTVQEKYQPIAQVNNQIINNSSYYIQLGAFAQTQNSLHSSKYIGQIESLGLNYLTKESRGLKLLLIGPYFSDKDARTDLHRAKTIVKGAFIKKIVE